MTLSIKNIVCILAIAFSFFSFGGAWAQSSDGQKDSKDIAKVRAKLTEILDGSGELEIESSPVKGVYRIFLNGSYAFVYVNDAHVMIGDLFDTKKKVNLGRQALKARIAKQLKNFPIEKTIVFGSSDAKRYITVFTDIDCGYCRTFHQEVPAINDAGIQVRYIAYPRAGVSSKSYEKFENVWCSKNQQAALTDAKSGKDVERKTCDNPIKETYELAQKIGVRGTPTIIFDDGRVMPGYLSHKELIKRLNAKP